MSLFLPEESPICDLKMDISGSCSSESPANTSPDVKPLSRAPCYLESDPDDGLRILKSPSDLEMAKSRTVHAIHPSLDNRPQAAQLISVHSHPLMSPEPSTDNESTNHFFAQDFKDIPLRLANPLGGSNRTLTPSPKRHVRLGQLDKDSASAVSSDSEADLSQYQANVGPSFQTVSLVAKPTTSLAKQKKSKFSSCSNIDEDSADERLRARQGSVESLSVRSFDDMDALSHLMSRSSSTSLIEDGATTTVRLGEASINGDPRPGRNSHTMILPDGTAREIDMKVIEPYKRVLSHGGYLKDDCQNAIVIFSCCFLPDRSRADYRYVMDSLFLYVLKTLEQLVTEDYVLLYLHGGSCKSNVPSFPWLKRCYQLLDRRLRKKIRNVYMVHPTFWVKSLVFMSRPFISSKFWRKLVYVKNLEELYALVPSVERQAVPEKVKSYDVAHFKQ